VPGSARHSSCCARAGRTKPSRATNRHGRVVLGEGAEDVREQLAANWWQPRGRGRPQ
jgi:hypothetical protein